MKIDPITAEQKEAWIAALESGKYNHGKNCLKNKKFNGCETHCCLGVLVDVLGYEISALALEHGDEHNGLSVSEFNRIKIGDEFLGYDFFEQMMSKSPTPAGQVSPISPLWTLNDQKETVDYTKQVDWIKKNVVV